MADQQEIRLRSGTGAIALSTDGKQLLVNGRPNPARKFNNLLSGRSVVAMPAGACLTIPTPNNIIAGRCPMVAYASMSGIRFHFAGMAHAELLPDNEVLVEAALELASGAIYPITFQGQRFGRLDRGGLLSSDVALADIAAGATYYARTRILAPNNSANLSPLNGYTTIAADISGGATTVTLTDLPYDRPSPLRMRIAGANTEIIEIIRMTIAASPYTATLRAAVGFAHTAAGSQVGQGFWTNREIASDEGATNTSASTTFDIYATSFGGVPSAAGATTLAALANAGDTSIQIVNVNPMRGQQWTLDTAGNLETINVRTVVGVANPYTAYLNQPLRIGHSNGVAVSNTNSGGGIIIPVPTVVTADYVDNPPSSVIILGDSIIGGTGYYFRPAKSWATLALDSTHPSLFCAKSGESAQQFAADTNGQQRRRLLDTGDWLLYAYGTNDIYGGRTLAQTQADTLTILGWARQRGVKIALCTITPRTTSTDGFVTVANQTEQNAGTAGLVRKAFNAWVRSGAGGFADLVVDVANQVETAQDSGLWKADTTIGPYTVDGLHPTFTGHQLMSAACNASLFV